MARSTRNRYDTDDIRVIIERQIGLEDEESAWPPNRAIAISVGGRYFCSMNKTGRLSTAWHISGAKLLAPWDYRKITDLMNRIHKKGHRVFLVAVAIYTPDEQVVENNDAPERMVVL